MRAECYEKRKALSTEFPEFTSPGRLQSASLSIETAEKWPACKEDPALRRSSKEAKACESVEQLIDKLQEELGELEAARRSGGQEALSEELGDLLFVVVNLARHLDVDPELALRSANRKFEDRFRYIEHRLAAQGRSPSQSSLEEMERLWEEAKHEDQGSMETPPTIDGS